MTSKFLQLTALKIEISNGNQPLCFIACMNGFNTCSCPNDKLINFAIFCLVIWNILNENSS